MERIEHPAHRAIDEALEVAFDRGQALANKLSKLAEAREKSEIAARLEARANELLARFDTSENQAATAELKATLGELRELLREASVPEPPPADAEAAETQTTAETALPLSDGREVGLSSAEVAKEVGILTLTPTPTLTLNLCRSHHPSLNLPVTRTQR